MSLNLAKQIATWTEESNEINQVSFIQWCSQQELHNLPLCHQGNSFRCNIKSPPPRAPQGSNYQYDYSRYSFDIVTLKVHIIQYLICMVLTSNAMSLHTYIG